MQRKHTKNTRGPNAKEKRFMAWVKEQPCCICGSPGPSICDHMYGSTKKHNKVLIGMWALLPYCYMCDFVKTHYSRKAHNKKFRKTQAEIFTNEFILAMPENLKPPVDVILAIKDWGR